MQNKIERLNFTLPAPLYEKVRKESYAKKMAKGKVVIIALQQYFTSKK